MPPCVLGAEEVKRARKETCHHSGCELALSSPIFAIPVAGGKVSTTFCSSSLDSGLDLMTCFGNGMGLSSTPAEA